MAKKLWGPSYQEPTIFNKGMFGGAIVGQILGIAANIGVGMIFPAAQLGIAGVATLLLSAFIGGPQRKADIELENKNGKPTSGPTLFNEGFFSGLNKTMFLAQSIVAGLAAAAAFGAPAFEIAGIPLTGVIPLAGLAIGGIAGAVTAFSGKARMEKEYSAALEMGKAQAQGHGRAPSKELEATPEPVIGKHAEVEMERRAQAGERHL